MRKQRLARIGAATLAAKKFYIKEKILYVFFCAKYYNGNYC